MCVCVGVSVPDTARSYVVRVFCLELGVEVLGVSWKNDAFLAETNEQNKDSCENCCPLAEAKAAAESPSCLPYSFSRMPQKFTSRSVPVAF